jgi:hypothetical protein
MAKLNYFLPLQIGAPDCFIYLKYKCFLLLNTAASLQKTLSFFIIKEVDLWSSSLIKIATLSSNSLPSSSSANNLIINNTVHISGSIGAYLAGLLEGDGHISLSKPVSLKTKNGLVSKDSSPYLAITFVNKDLPLINKLLDLFGGRLRFKDKENAIVWTIGKHKELVNMINLLNGYLRTPKIIKFNDLIVFVNQKYNYNIQINSPDTSHLNKNGWLAGFIDADGAFKIRYTEKLICDKTSKVLRKGRIEVRFALEQRKKLVREDFDFFEQSDKTLYSYEAIMLQIYSFFEITTDLRLSTHSSPQRGQEVDNTYFIVEVTSLSKLNILIQYLNTYPLLTAKRNDYDDWVKAYKLMLDQKHLTESGKLLIKQIKSNMNRKRGVFNWDHLNYLNKIQ